MDGLPVGPLPSQSLLRAQAVMDFHDQICRDDIRASLILKRFSQRCRVACKRAFKPKAQTASDRVSALHLLQTKIQQRLAGRAESAQGRAGSSQASAFQPSRNLAQPQRTLQPVSEWHLSQAIPVSVHLPTVAPLKLVSRGKAAAARHKSQAGLGRLYQSTLDPSLLWDDSPEDDVSLELMLHDSSKQLPLSQDTAIVNQDCGDEEWLNMDGTDLPGSHTPLRGVAPDTDMVQTQHPGQPMGQPQTIASVSYLQSFPQFAPAGHGISGDQHQAVVPVAQQQWQQQQAHQAVAGVTSMPPEGNLTQQQQGFLQHSAVPGYHSPHSTQPHSAVAGGPPIGNLATHGTVYPDQEGDACGMEEEI